MENVIVFGIGEIAEVASFYLEHASSYKVVAHTVEANYLAGDIFNNLPVIAWEEILDKFSPTEVKLFAPVSYHAVNQTRKRIYLEGKKLGFEFISFVHPDCHCYARGIGDNCMILENNIIQPGVTVGNNVILWSGNHIGHHSSLGDHCFVASHVVISGSVAVGERCFLGVNSTVRDNIQLGDACVIGAGAVVSRSLEPETVVASPPMRIGRFPSSKLKRI